MTRGIFFLILVVAILALDWAALHDIIQGEPDAVLEWTVVVFSVVVMIGIGLVLLRSRKGRPAPMP